MEIDKKDAIFLDLIIEKIIETDQPLWSDTFKDFEHLNIDDEKLRELEFTRLINIISYKGVGKSETYQYYHDSIQRNENTVKFKERGGFTKLFQDELDRIDKAENTEKLKTKNLELQNENLEFSQTIREQEATIRDLEIKIKGIELIKQYWWFIGICILAGGILKELLDLLIEYT